MMRRLVSAPKPASRESAITCSAEWVPSSATRNPNRIASNRARFDDASLGRIR